MDTLLSPIHPGETIFEDFMQPLELTQYRPATEQEIREAALQYVRKVSGYRKPSKAKQSFR
jgi:plasmid maintenance system antidote protein VapI